MIWPVLAWLSQHLGLVLGVGLFVIAFTYIISAAVYGLWLASESRREDEQRKRFNKIVQASHGKPGAPGFPHRRIS